MWPHVSKGPPLHSVSRPALPFTAEQYSTARADHPSFPPAPAAGLWALRAATSNTRGNTRSRLRPGRTVTLGLTLCWSARLLAKVAGPAGQAPSKTRGFRFLHILADVCSYSSDFRHPRGCDFAGLHSLRINDVQYLFMLIGHYFAEMSTQILCSFVKIRFSYWFKTVLYNFSHSAEVSSLESIIYSMKSSFPRSPIHLFFFFFFLVIFALGVASKKPWRNPRPWRLTAGLYCWDFNS